MNGTAQRYPEYNFQELLNRYMVEKEIAESMRPGGYICRNYKQCSDQLPVVRNINSKKTLVLFECTVGFGDATLAGMIAKILLEEGPTIDLYFELLTAAQRAKSAEVNQNLITLAKSQLGTEEYALLVERFPPETRQQWGVS